MPTQLELRYTVRRADADGAVLGAGAVPIQIFAPVDLEGYAARLAGRELTVWDADDGLPRLLNARQVPPARFDSASALLTTRADLILVGPDRLDDEHSFEALLNQARRGASVWVFRQTKVTALGPYSLACRPGAPMRWRTIHPVLRDLPGEAWQSMIGPGDEWAILLLPANEPALEICYWPAEVEGKEPAPIDALLVSRSIGAGRIVLCQLRAGDPMRDPRSQILIRSALDYLLTRPRPTPVPRDRLSPASAAIPATGPSVETLVEKRSTTRATLEAQP